MINIKKTLYDFIKSPFLILASKGLFDKMPDDKYLCHLYREQVGRKLNLSNPKTYTEKIQWLKLYDRKPIYTVMQDKLLVRNIVAEKIGNEYLVPLFGAWDDVDEIDFASLPEQFVLKCNHDSASVTICKEKNTFDFEKAKKHLNLCLRRDYSQCCKEWAYKDIPHKILAEKYMQEGESDSLTDYKFFCFNGKAKMVMVISGKPHSSQRKHITYNMNFERIPVYKKNDLEPGDDFCKPKCFDRVALLAEKIAEGIPFIRVDFYIINEHPYFGEVAFYPDSGFLEFYPTEWEKTIGSWINLPAKSE